MQKTYLTIKENTDAELTEKKSRFIANVFYVKNETNMISCDFLWFKQKKLYFKCVN